MGTRVELTVLDTSDIVLRPLPGGYLQISRGLLVACAGEGAREKVAALLGHGIAHVKAGDAERLSRGLSWTEPFGGSLELPSTVSSLVDGAVNVDDQASALGSAVKQLEAMSFSRAFPEERFPRPPCAGLDRDVASALLLVGIDGTTALRDAYAALACTEDAEPARLQGFSCAHGPLSRLLDFAHGIPRIDAESRTRTETLDLDPLAAQSAICALLDAAALLARRRAPDAALRLIADLRGARASVVRGWALLAKNEPREAERALRTALLLEPDSYAARIALGDTYAAMQRPEAARAEYLEALKRAPLLAEVHLKLGLVEADRGKGHARLEIARALAGDGDPIARRATEILDPQRGEVEAPERERIRILSGSGGE
jgi:tetratricopeptide (TPR) repeat protein